ncbi:aspartic proteinase CDR1-like [Salvia splendens]|uniref:aspartic proteinase CDR1-like n=1 Tax=Salvia splendens TaxID=180675 RepID=UPI001C276FA4|nr:aspartic proteinase CDR1-like [Salvia splendens]
MPSCLKSMSTFLCSLLLYSLCLTYSIESTGDLTFNFIHRDSHRSPSYDPSITRFQRLRHAVDRSLSRKSSLIALRSKSSTESIVAPIIPSDYEYLMKIKIGTPPAEQLAIADTGSDLTWTQCKLCTECFNQTLPLFDPSQSSSYRPVPVGELATEILTFDGGVSFPKFAFGCGFDNGGSFSYGSGIVGLGGGSISIINQLNTSIGGKFSYCLPLLDSNATSKISFGSSAVVAGPKVVSTLLVKKSPPDTFYYLTLEGLSVGLDSIANAEPELPSLGSNEGNMIIDLGTTLSFVPDEIYNRVEAMLEGAVKGERVEAPPEPFQMCYRMEDGFSSPPVTAHFKNANVVLVQEGVFLEVEKGIVCLTLIPAGGDIGVFGNLHQMNYRIGYDLVEGQLSFLPTHCSNPQSKLM